MLLKDLIYTTNEFKRPKVNWLKDRIQPYMLLKMPKGDWIEFSLGIFILSTPVRKEQNGMVYRDVEAYDKLVLLQENRTIKRISIIKGARYYDFLVGIFEEIGVTKWNVEYTDKTAVTTTEWEIGTDYLKIINDVLSVLNYTPIFVDEYGFFSALLYRSPQQKAIDVEYVADEFSVIHDGTTEEMDLFNVPNAWLFVLNDAERESLKAYIENNNPDSPTSYQSRGNRRIVEKREVDDIADQQSLTEMTERVAFESSQVFGKVSFTTALMPIHAYSDVVYLKNDTLEIDGKYAETGWSMELENGGTMSHEVRAVVNIG